jgi:hypothetical protein
MKALSAEIIRTAGAGVGVAAGVGSIVGRGIFVAVTESRGVSVGLFIRGILMVQARVDITRMIERNVMIICLMKVLYWNVEFVSMCKHPLMLNVPTWLIGNMLKLTFVLFKLHIL